MILLNIITSGLVHWHPSDYDPKGFFLTMRRVVFLVDGFNLYHSIVDIGHYNKGLCVKWLNIDSFCKSFLPLLGKDAKFEQIYYFSAYAFHLNDPSVIQRHKNYIECLEATGVIAELGRFKCKEIKYPHCKKQIHYRWPRNITVVIIRSPVNLFSIDTIPDFC